MQDGNKIQASKQELLQMWELSKGWQLSIIIWPQSCSAYENTSTFKHTYFFHSAMSIPLENNIKGKIWVMSQPNLSKEVTLTWKNCPCKSHWLLSLSLLTNSGSSDIPSIWVLFKSYPAISRIVGPKSIFATSICRMRRTLLQKFRTYFKYSYL